MPPDPRPFILKREGFSGSLGVSPKGKHLVLLEKGKPIPSTETEKYKIDAESEFASAQKLIRGAFEQYVKAFPKEVEEVALACHERRRAALNKHQATPDYSWRLSMIIPVALDVFIKRYVPNYLRNDRLRHWMMREFKGFVVPDNV